MIALLVWLKMRYALESRPVIFSYWATTQNKFRSLSEGATKILTIQDWVSSTYDHERYEICIEYQDIRLWVCEGKFKKNQISNTNIILKISWNVWGEPRSSNFHKRNLNLIKYHIFDAVACKVNWPAVCLLAADSTRSKYEAFVSWSVFLSWFSVKDWF